MNKKEILEDLYVKIENKLQSVIKETEPVSLKEPFDYLIKNGGKRIRPLLTCLFAGIINADEDSAVSIGSSIEILHNFTLVHDDIMDNSTLRRSNPTVHVKYGLSSAILVGDVMIGYACNLMPKSHHPNLEILQRLFTEALIVVCQGQALDIDYNIDKNITIELYLDMINKKTANLFKVASLMGLYLGNPNNELVQIVHELSIKLGLAFQIQDDYLDLFGTTEFGKTKAQDLIEGKKTFMILKTNQLSKTDSQKSIIENFYKNNGIKPEEINEMLNLMNELNIPKISKELIFSYYDDVVNLIDKLPKNIYKELLYDLVTSIRTRVI